MNNAMMMEMRGVNAPDHLGDYVNAFRAGRALAAETTVAPGLSTATAPPASPPTLNDAQRAEAARRAEIFCAVGTGLASVRYPQRASILAHMTQALANQGVPADVVGNFDPTDAALAASIEQARAVSQTLASR